jgi:hypothetical protein
VADQNDLLTAAEFAAKARVDIRSVRMWEGKGVGPKPIRPPGSRIVRYRRGDIDAWLRGDVPAIEAAS